MDVQGYCLGSPHGTTTAVTVSKLLCKFQYPKFENKLFWLSLLLRDNDGCGTPHASGPCPGLSETLFRDKTVEPYVTSLEIWLIQFITVQIIHISALLCDVWRNCTGGKAFIILCRCCPAHQSTLHSAMFRGTWPLSCHAFITLMLASQIIINKLKSVLT